MRDWRNRVFKLSLRAATNETVYRPVDGDDLYTQRPSVTTPEASGVDGSAENGVVVFKPL